MRVSLDHGDMIVELDQPTKQLKQELGARALNRTNGGRNWKLPPITLNVARLVELYGEEILTEMPSMLVDLYGERWGFYGFTTEERAQAEDHPSWNRLYEWQKDGVEYLFCNPHGAAMLQFGPRLGKAVVTAVTLDLLEAERVLILAPLTLAKQWTHQLNEWCEGERDIKRARAGDREPGDGITIANHEVIQEVVLRDEDGDLHEGFIPGVFKDDGEPATVGDSKRVREWINSGPTKVNEKGKEAPVRERITRLRRDYLNMDWDVIVCDESILIKNRKALKQGILATLRKHGHNGADTMMWELSGSPTTKYNDDLYAQMQILFPRAFTSYWRFAEFFTIVDKEGWGWTIEGNREDRDPHHYLRDLIYRRSESDIDVKIPEYTVEELHLEAEGRQRKALDQMLDEWMVELESEPDERVDAPNWLARTTRLSQITSNLGSLPKPSGTGFYAADGIKLAALLDLIANDDIEFPLLTWTWFRETADIVHKALSKHVNVEVVTGSSNDKEGPIEAYKRNELDAIVLQVGVGKFGHTLMNSKTVYYHDRTFDSDAMYQSLFRARGLGSEHSPRLIVPKVENSADMLIDANMEGKFRSIAQMTNMDLRTILETLRSEQ